MIQGCGQSRSGGRREGGDRVVLVDLEGRSWVISDHRGDHGTSNEVAVDRPPLSKPAEQEAIRRARHDGSDGFARACLASFSEKEARSHDVQSGEWQTSQRVFELALRSQVEGRRSRIRSHARYERDARHACAPCRELGDTERKIMVDGAKRLAAPRLLHRRADRAVEIRRRAEDARIERGEVDDAFFEPVTRRRGTERPPHEADDPLVRRVSGEVTSGLRADETGCAEDESRTKSHAAGLANCGVQRNRRRHNCARAHGNLEGTPASDRGPRLRHEIAMLHPHT